MVVVADGGDTAGRFSLVEWSMAPGPKSGSSLHRHLRSDEAFYVLEGLLEITVDDRTDRLGPGKFVFVERMTWHTVANGGTAVCRFLITTSPPGLEALWHRKSELLSNARNESPEDLSALYLRFGVETQTEAPALGRV